MAIDLGRFGNVVAQPAQQQAARIESGAEALGAINAVASSYLQQQTVKAEQERNELNKGRAAVMLAEYGNAINDIHTTLADEVRTGKLPAEKTVEEFKKRADERITTMLNPLADKEFAETMRPTLQAYQIKGLATAGAVQTQYVQLNHAQELDKATGENSKLFRLDPTTAALNTDAAYDNLGPKAGLTAAQIAELKAKNKDAGWFDNRQFWLENTNDINALSKERDALNGGAYADLSNDHRLALMHSADAKIKQLQGLQEAEAREAAQKDAQYVQAAHEQMANGVPLNAGTVAELSRIKSRNPMFTPDVDALFTAANAISSLNTMPVVPTQTRIDATGAEGTAVQSQQGLVDLLTKRYQAATTLEEKRRAETQLALVSKAVDANAKAWTTQPYIKLQEVTGKPVPMLDPTRSDFGAQLQQRIAYQRKASTISGLSTPLLSDDDAKATIEYLKSEQVNAQDKLNAIRALALTSKHDPKGTIGAFASKEPVLAAAIAAEQMNIGYKSGGVMRPVANDILRGFTLAQNKDAVNNLTNPPDPQDAPRWKRDKKAIEDGYIGDAYAGNATGRAQVVTLAENIYLSLAEQHRGEMTSDEHARLRKVSLQLATGNIYTINGHQVPGAFGLNESTFKRQVTDQLTALALGGKQPTAQPVSQRGAFGFAFGDNKPFAPSVGVQPELNKFEAPQAGEGTYEYELMNNSHLVQVGQGVYHVYLGQDLQIGADGKPLIVKVKP